MPKLACDGSPLSKVKLFYENIDGVPWPLSTEFMASNVSFAFLRF